MLCGRFPNLLRDVATLDLLQPRVQPSAAQERERQLQAELARVTEELADQQAQYDAARSNEDEDEARVLCRIFTELGEQYLQLLLTQQPDWALSAAAAVLRGAAGTSSPPALFLIERVT